ncbi:MAG: ATP-grasp domain-containing protein [Planctomycetes bacterium]|nr:ATP-grasp domain-containing protein [Planctomycetota bacterium]
MRTLRIGVSGINAADNPGPGTGIARSLKEDRELNVELIGLAYDALEPGIYMDWLFDRSFTLPYPSTEGREFLDRLLEIQAGEGLDWVIPNLDVELPLYIKYADELARNGIQTFLPTMSQFRLRGKDKLPEIAARIDMAVPKTAVVSSEEMLYEACEKIGYPVMVKGAYYQAFRAYTALEAVAKFRAIAAEWGYPVIVQQVITGEEVNLVGVGDGRGGLLGSVAMKKVSLTSLGKVWSAVTLKNAALQQAAERLVAALNWRGPFELECMLDPSDDELYLIEINPRFPAWSYFATGVGINLPGRMIRHASGMPVAELPDYEAGQLFMRYTYEMVTDMQRLQSLMMRGGSL